MKITANENMSTTCCRRFDNFINALNFATDPVKGSTDAASLVVCTR